MTPKQFLTIGGAILVLVAILGFVGIIGPSSDKSMFGDAWVFDNYENWAHLVIGVVGLIAAFAASEAVQKPLTIAVGVVALFFGLYNFFSTTFLGAGLQSPADLILHLIIGVWAIWASMGKEA